MIRTMLRARLGRTLAIALTVALVFGTGTAFVALGNNDSGDVYFGCIDPGGNLKDVVVNPAEAPNCEPNHTLITWNQVGPVGPQGEQGLQGEKGDKGDQGEEGPAGEDGQDGLNCWDRNGNGEVDPEEDINDDSVVDAMDCQGATGDQGDAGPQGPAGLVNTVQRTGGIIALGPSQFGTADAFCEDGETMTGGGFETELDSSIVTKWSYGLFSYPTSNGIRDGWTVGAQNPGTSTTSDTFRAYVLCAAP